MLILASSSPRRRELLGRLGLEFDIVPSGADESLPEGIAPAEAVSLLSFRKACDVSSGRPGDTVIAADTLVALGGRTLGKPSGAEEAAAMLASLSGRTHEVFTGVTVRRGGRALTGVERTAVCFRRLTQREISAYVASGEPMDKAGAYGIQALGALLVAGIEGDYFNVMGLPLVRLYGMLADFGINLL